MNSESFIKHLKDHSFLHQSSYQELKTLSLQYPYCQNIHLLLLKKSFLDNNQEWQSNLEKAATYTFDRTRLFQLMQTVEQEFMPQETFLLSDDYLELKELGEEADPIPAPALTEHPSVPLALDIKEESTTLSSPDEVKKQEDSSYPREEELLLGAAQTSTDPSPTQDSTTENDSIQTIPSYRPDLEVISKLITLSEIMSGISLYDKPIITPEEQPSMKAQFTTGASASDSLLTKLKQRDNLHLKKIHTNGLIELTDVDESKPAPQPKRSFNSWLKQFQEPSIKGQLEDIMEYKKLREVKKKKKKTNKLYQMPPIAVKSITENSELASETLAELLVNQGRFNKAIKMYNRLVLLFPEKSSYFAAKINNLKST